MNVVRNYLFFIEKKFSIHYSLKVSHYNLNQHLLITLNSTKLDESDFILLATKLLEINLKQSSDFLYLYPYIKHQYLLQNYSNVIASIADLYRKHERLLGTNLVQKVLNKIPFLISDPKENNSRRFYETLYAYALESLIKKENNYSTFTELNEIYKQKKTGDTTTKDLLAITNFEEAEQLILSFEMLNNTIGVPLKKASATYNTKDRLREKSGTVFSTNPGIMNPNAPNFLDNQIPVREIKKMNIDRKKIKGYSISTPQIPFVGSLSGSTFSLITILAHYIDKHMADCNLETKINTIIKLWVSTYIKQRYHSYRELIDVFREPHIQTIFSAANIQLHYEMYSNTDKEFNLAQNYALVTNTKYIMHQELLKKKPHQPIGISLVSNSNTLFCSYSFLSSDKKKQISIFTDEQNIKKITVGCN